MKTKVVFEISELDETIERNFEVHSKLAKTNYELAILWWLYFTCKTLVSILRMIR